MDNLTPKNRFEQFLAKISGEQIEISPKTRFEQFLAKISGEQIEISPKTRFEYWLNKIASAINGGNDEGGSGGGSGSSDFSTAKVTVIDSNGTATYLFGDATCFIKPNQPSGYTTDDEIFTQFTKAIDEKFVSQSVSFDAVLSTAVLFTDACTINLFVQTTSEKMGLSNANTEIYGNITWDENLGFIVRGDCTITYI